MEKERGYKIFMWICEFVCGGGICVDIILHSIFSVQEVEKATCIFFSLINVVFIVVRYFSGCSCYSCFHWNVCESQMAPKSKDHT